MASGYLNFTPGLIPTATQWKEYVGLQTVGLYASAAARDAELAAVLREGIFAYLADAPNRLTYYDGSAWQTVTSDYTTWSPTYANITVGNGTVFALYAFVGMKTVHCTWQLTLGSSTALGTSPQVTLPITPGSAADVGAGIVTMNDTGVSSYPGKLSYVSGSNCELTQWAAGGTIVSTTQITGLSPFAWAAGDSITFGVTYRV